jgi:hypothetical protein
VPYDTLAPRDTSSLIIVQRASFHDSNCHCHSSISASLLPSGATKVEGHYREKCPYGHRGERRG